MNLAHHHPSGILSRQQGFIRGYTNSSFSSSSKDWRVIDICFSRQHWRTTRTQHLAAHRLLSSRDISKRHRLLPDIQHDISAAQRHLSLCDISTTSASPETLADTARTQHLAAQWHLWFHHHKGSITLRGLFGRSHFWDHLSWLDIDLRHHQTTSTSSGHQKQHLGGSTASFIFATSP